MLELKAEFEETVGQVQAEGQILGANIDKKSKQMREQMIGWQQEQE